MGEQVDTADLARIPAVTADPVRLSFGIRAVALDEDHGGGPPGLEQLTRARLPGIDSDRKGLDGDGRDVSPGPGRQLRVHQLGRSDHRREMGALGDEHDLGAQPADQGAGEGGGTDRTIGFAGRQIR